MEKKNKVKKTKKRNVYYATTEQSEMKKLIIILIVVAICVAGVYVLTRAFVTKDLFNSKENTEEVIKGEINYDVTIIGEMLTRPYDSYYVAIYNQEEGDYVSDMSSLVYSYNNLEKHSHIYSVNLANVMNSEYYDPKNINTKATGLSDLKVGDLTLIKVKNGKIEKIITDLSKMKIELGIK